MNTRKETEKKYANLIDEIIQNFSPQQSGTLTQKKIQYVLLKQYNIDLSYWTCRRIIIVNLNKSIRNIRNEI